MVNFLENLSLTGVIVALICVMVITPLVQFALRHRHVALWFRSDESVVNYVQMLTVFYGLLLGLVAVELWQRQDDAEKNTVDEANQVRIVSDLAASVPGDKQVVNDALGDYVQGVIKKEWPMMVTEQQREMFAASPELDNVRSAIMQLEPKTEIENAVFQKILDHYGEMVETRQRRLLDSERALPPVLRITLILGAVFTWACTFFIQSQEPHSQFVLTAITGGYLFMLLYLILVLEHPFLGAWHVTALPYERALEILH